jgi:hypothetical protein
MSANPIRSPAARFSGNVVISSEMAVGGRIEGLRLSSTPPHPYVVNPTEGVLLRGVARFFAEEYVDLV